MSDYVLKMPDNFNVAAITNLEQDLSKLGMTKVDSESLINDGVFKHFATALSEPLSDFSELWQETCNLQIYPDPVEYLAPINNFAQFFHNVEPGCYTDYKTMRENLDGLQDYIPGGQQTLLDMYDFINTFTGEHVHFVRSSIAMYGWQLYSKMAARFYGYIRDPPFEEFVKQSVECTDDTAAWPSYATVQNTLRTNMGTAQLAMEEASRKLFSLKSSNDLILFHANIDAAVRAKESIDAERILAKYIGSQTRAERARRKAAVASRNIHALRDRVSKNSSLRRRNAANVHQFGCMARTPISEPVLRALTALQEKYSDGLFADEEKEADVEDEVEKKVVAKMQGLSVAAQFGGDYLDDMEEVMKVREPMGGILVGEGYHTVDFFGA